jgi:hypothetical protein
MMRGEVSGFAGANRNVTIIKLTQKLKEFSGKLLSWHKSQHPWKLRPKGQAVHRRPHQKDWSIRPGQWSYDLQH